MKKLYITAGLMLSMLSVQAQTKHTLKADKLFETYQYVSAIEEYLKIAESKHANPYVFKQLADSYYNVFNSEQAALWYSKAVASKQDAETYYRYAQVLKSQGNYKEANRQMDKFSALEPSDDRAKEHKANPNYIPTLHRDGKLFEVKDTQINSKDQSDFGAIIAPDQSVYFASTRNSSNKKDKWVNQPYLDIYQVTRNVDGTLGTPTQVSELNTPFHDGPVTISADGNTMFFARDGHSEGAYEKDKKHNIKVSQQGIYKATKSNGKWVDVQALSINSTNYSVSHPSLSKDGKTLYFASNMPGGYGDTDIWKISVNGSDYGKPENLGANVNSAGKEGFPFITEDNELYFSSSGKRGLGGLDVFKIDLKSTNAEAINIGNPVNTEKDDFAFSFYPSQGVGYFSSNRSGSDNIYEATPVCLSKAIATVIDKKSGKVLMNAKVSILDAKNNVIATEQTNAKGEVSYPIACETDYVLQASIQGYDAASVALSKTKLGVVDTTIELEPTEVIITDTEVILKPIFFEFNKSNITSQGALELDKLVKVLKDNPTMSILVKSHTDSKGTASYNLNLSEQRAQSTVQYLVSKGINKDRLSGKGFGMSEPKIDCKDCTDEQDAINRRSEFIIVRK